MKYDELFPYIGEIGTYQICLFLNLAALAFWGVESIAINFVGGMMDHWCQVDELQDLPHQHQKYVAIPNDEDDTDEYSTCDMFKLNYSQYGDEDFLTWNRSLMVDHNTPLQECDAWVYDQSEFVSTIQSEWDLVCGKSWLISMSSTMYMFGILVGALAAGVASDRIGRRLALWISIWLKILGGFLATYAPEIISFCLGRCLLGMGSTGTYLIGFIIVMENVGNTWRNVLGVMHAMAFSLGYMVLPLISYAIRDHVTYQLVLTIPNMITLVYIWVIPESPRWLIVKERHSETERVIRYIADVNRVQLPDGFTGKTLEKDTVEGEQGTCADLMRYPRMRVRTFVIYFHWFTTSLMYYALSLNTGALAGSVFLNTFIAGAVEIPANLLCIVCMNWRYLGRRWTCGLSLIVAGICSFSMIPFIANDLDTGTVTFSMLGKAFTTMAFSGIYVYSAELFPTEVRNVGMGTASMFARISSMAAPFMGPPLASVWQPLPSLVFGIVGTAAGLLALLLPETLGQEMLETVEEAEAFKGRSKTKKEPSLSEKPPPEKCGSANLAYVSDAYYTTRI